MRSAKTDPTPATAAPVTRSPRGLMQRLNVRLVIALASVVFVALLVSGATLNQILPGLFVSQAETRAGNVAGATAFLIEDGWSKVSDDVLNTPELRNTQFLQPLAQAAANTLAQGTVTITYLDGSPAAAASPTSAFDTQMRAQGLRPDSEVEDQRSRTDPILLPGLPARAVVFVVTVSKPYTTRLTTLDSVRGTLLFTGVIALVVSMVVGVLVARRLTTPLARLRRAASRLAQGQLDERAPRSSVVEIDDLARQFNVMADRLSESLRMLEADRDQLRDFVADVSHELRTPIAALRAFTDLQRDGQVDEATRSEFLDRSSEQISRLDWMSTNLLDLSRIDAGIFPLDVRPGDLRDPIRSVVEAHAELAEQRGVSLISEVPSTPVMQRFDRERIVQLLSNLVGNGLKFTPRDGQVSVHLTDAPEGAVLEVRDSGPGILADELPRIFERFFRGTNVGVARASGSGLGLAIARSIVEMHGGQIEVASKIGEGSSFTVRLPRSAAVAQGQ
jgi:signal transduction histidine kinase